MKRFLHVFALTASVLPLLSHAAPASFETCTEPLGRVMFVPWGEINPSYPMVIDTNLLAKVAERTKCFDLIHFNPVMTPQLMERIQYSASFKIANVRQSVDSGKTIGSFVLPLFEIVLPLVTGGQFWSNTGARGEIHKKADEFEVTLSFTCMKTGKRHDFSGVARTTDNLLASSLGEDLRGENQDQLLGLAYVEAQNKAIEALRTKTLSCE